MKSKSSAPPFIDPGSGETIIVFSHLRWNFVFQRPQHLLSRAAENYSVLFFEEPIYEARLKPALAASLSREGVCVIVPVLPAGMAPTDAVEAQRELLDDLLERLAPSRLTAWYYTPMALEFSDHLRPDSVVYDCMDELSSFKGAPGELQRLEQELFRRADVVFTGGHSLYEAKRTRHNNIHPVPSSIDAAHFRTARSRSIAEPSDQAGIAGPRIGFFAVIDERLDVDLLAETAERRPQWSFVVLGPVVKIDPGSLPRRPNLHWLGSKSYDQLPAYLAGWDAGFMPFAINEATRFISPTKTPEFLAAGVPVVSTPIRDVVRPYGVSGLVEIASDAEAVVECLERVMSRPKAGWLDAVDSHLAGMSWDRTWQEMDWLRNGGSKAARATPMRWRAPAGIRPEAVRV